MRTALLVATTALLAPAIAAAQRSLDLTGPPQRTLSEPFSQIAGVRALPVDMAIVTDQLEQRVFLVNFGTDTRTQIGRQGSGPGEYRFPLRPLAAPNGLTWMLDASLRRVLTVSAAGRFQESLAAPYSAVPGGLGAAIGTDRAGRLYFEGSSFDAETGGFTDSIGIVRWNPTTNRADIIGRVWSGGRVRVERRGGAASVARSVLPFPEVDAWVVLPDGRIAIIEQRPHRLRVLGGSPPGVFTSPELAATSVPVTAAERNAYREREEGARMVAAGSGGAAQRRPPTADAEFPATMPAFIASSVLASPEGEIWVGRSFAFNAPTRRYDIFDATGQLIGVATLRRDATVVGFGDGLVLVARTDPDDHLVYLELYRR
jgi:hypothetical protein